MGTKLLYDIGNKFNIVNGEASDEYCVFENNMIEAYNNYPDYYIRESIIHVMSKMMFTEKTAIFFRNLISSDNTLTAKSIVLMV